MNCSICNSNTMVVNTINGGYVTYRRRKCLNCNNSFYTIECEADEADLEDIRFLIAKKKRNQRNKNRGNM